MKLQHLLPACALALPLCASAVPAYPGLLPRTLEDGSTIMVRQNGDEFFNYLTDEQGFLLTPASNGKLSYRLDPNGARMMASPILLQSLKAEAFERLNPEMRRAAENRGPARIAQHDGNGRTTFPTKGDIHYLVVLMQYSDLKWSMADPATAMNELLNGENYHDNGAVGSMRQYLVDCSHGGLNPTFDIVGPVTLPKTNAYYVGTEKYDNIREAVSEAAKAVDDVVDFTKYDYDNDGIIDNVIFFYAGYGAADTEKGVGIWPHNSSAYSTNLTLDGKRFGPYCCFNELNGGYHWINKDGVINGIGTPVHEFGHVMGFPDLYDPDYQVKCTPGDWSVFDSGAYNGDGYAPAAYSAYERYLFGWEEPMELTEPGTYTLPASSQGGGSYRVNVYRKNSTIYKDEFFLFESRDNNGWDSYLPGSGMLIWHVDYNRSIFTNNTVNSTLSRNRCRLITADGSALYELGTTSDRAKNAAWPQDINYITPDTRIKLNYRCIEAPTPRVIPHFFTDIAYDTETGVSSFEYDVITATPDLTTVLHTPVRLEENDRVTNKVRFEWDPVEGAESYLFTLYRVNSQGKIYYENSLDAKDMGLETSYEYNFPSNKMGIEFHASVRVKNKIPALEPSNEVIFTPSELSTTGIEDVTVDEVMPVRGLQGAIDAPADARIFTLAGAPAGRTDLPAGIYIVKCGERTYKVIVK